MEMVLRYIYEQVASQNLSKDDAKIMLAQLEEHSSDTGGDIAIIGMACKFPKAQNVSQFWQNICKGRKVISRFPLERRMDTDLLVLDKIPEHARSKVNLDQLYKWGSYLNEVDKFDAAFFRLSPREAKFMDPLQRLFLESAWESIEDAGYGGDKIVGTRTGVFVGRDYTGHSQYKNMSKERDQMQMTGSWAGILASRLAYIFDLRGPSIVIDTACSSGLVSVHSACKSLRLHECDLAIAGGINLDLCPIGGDDLEILEAPDHRVKTFDRDAQGTIFGEGVAAVFLKPLEKALEDGDHIYAVIKGSAINNDGASNGITAPNAEAQEDVIIKAWEDAQIEPESISLIEAHGTGTVLGDPIEIKGLTNAFSRYTDRKQFCAISSAKTGLGHLVGASGMAGLIKVVMALKYKLLPANLNFEEPNPYINFYSSPIYVNDQLREWERGEYPRRAGVSSFGFSGTNCHIIIEEAPEMDSIIENSTPQILALSAKSKKVLEDLINNYAEYVSAHNDLHLTNLCYTANTGRGHYSHRLIMVVHSIDDLKTKIKQISQTDLDNLAIPDVYYGENKTVSSTKKERTANEVTEREKKQISKIADERIQHLVQSESDDFPELIHDICELYIKGAEIHWEYLYQGQKVRRVSIPTYPLERTRQWIIPKLTETTPTKVKKLKEINHPLLDRRMVDSFKQEIYETDFSIEQHWVLTDHKIAGNCLIPGTTYLEVLRKSVEKYFPDNVIEIRDLIFTVPVIVQKDEVKTVQTILSKEKDHYQVTVASKNEADDSWIVHVQGKVYKNEYPKPDNYDINWIRSQCPNVIKGDVNQLILDTKNGLFSFGRRWENLNRVAIGQDQAFIELELPTELKDADRPYVLHPALLDNAINLVSQSIGNDTYLPLSYKSFKFYGNLPTKFFSYLRKKETPDANLETVPFDIILMDEEGKVLVEVEDYHLKKVRAADLKFKELSNQSIPYYQVGWINEQVEISGATIASEKILFFKGETELSKELSAELTGQGVNLVEVELGNEYKKITDQHYTITMSMEDYDQLILELKDIGITRIIHGLTLADQEISSLEDLENHQQKGLYSLFYLTKALVNNKVKDSLDLFIISDYVHQVNGSEEQIKAENAPLLGLAKVVVQEHSNLRVRSIDIDQETGVQEIISELLAINHKYLVAYRHGQRYVEEFQKISKSMIQQQEMEIKDQGVYLITGGTGGIGLEVAKYLAEHNQVNLALLNRSSIPAKDSWESIIALGEDGKLAQKLITLREIEELGANVICYSADISKIDEVKPIIDELRKKYGQINGIVHSAGVAGDGFIIRKDEEVFREVIAPKVQGSWILDYLTREDDLDFFFLFSSGVTLTGSVGQSDYTSANSYLDAFAFARSKLGKRTAVINWPAWKETGMAVDYGVGDEFGLFKGISTLKGIEVLSDVMHSDLIKVIPGDINYKVLISIIDKLPFAFSKEIQEVLEKQKTHLMAGSKSSGQRMKINVTVSGKNCNPTELQLGTIWGQVLGLSELDVYESFYDLGGDSLLATQLLKEIDQEFPGVLDISDIFTYPTVVQLAEYIDQKEGRTHAGEEEDLDLEIDLTEESTSDESDEELMQLLAGLESGQISVDESAEALNELEWDEDE